MEWSGVPVAVGAHRARKQAALPLPLPLPLPRLRRWEVHVRIQRRLIQIGEQRLLEEEEGDSNGLWGGDGQGLGKLVFRATMSTEGSPEEEETPQERVEEEEEEEAVEQHNQVDEQIEMEVEVEKKEEEEEEEEEADVKERTSPRSPPKEAVVGGIPDSFKSELYFLVAKFLEGDPRTAPAAEALKKELDRGQLLTPRYDWTGKAHPNTFSEMGREVGMGKDGGALHSDHLLRLCFKLSGMGLDGGKVGGSAATRTLVGRHPVLNPSLPPPGRSHCLSALRNREFGLPASLSPSSSGRAFQVRLSRQLRRLRRTLGHLSAVYCLLFDRTGRLVITGADDLLVKCWRARDGRLIHTFRGASSEISDLAVSHDNRSGGDVASSCHLQ